MSHQLVFTATEAPALFDAETLATFRALGATHVQLNTDDEAVADAALRLHVFSPPIRSVLWVHTSGQPLATLALAQEVGWRGAAWEVEQRQPIDPPPQPAGVRSEALANLAFLRIPEGMSREEWLDYWLDTHTQIAIDTQAAFGYVQNVVLRCLTPDVPGAAEVAGIVEELFPMAAITDSHAFYGSDGDQAELDRRLGLMLDSIARFGADRDLDLVPTSRCVLLDR